MGHKQLVGAGYELAAVPKTSGGLQGKQVGERGNCKYQPAHQIIQALITTHTYLIREEPKVGNKSGRATPSFGLQEPFRQREPQKKQPITRLLSLGKRWQDKQLIL